MFILIVLLIYVIGMGHMAHFIFTSDLFSGKDQPNAAESVWFILVWPFSWIAIGIVIIINFLIEMADQEDNE